MFLPFELATSTRIFGRCLGPSVLNITIGFRTKNNIQWCHYIHLLPSVASHVPYVFWTWGPWALSHVKKVACTRPLQMHTLFWRKNCLKPPLLMATKEETALTFYKRLYLVLLATDALDNLCSLNVLEHLVQKILQVCSFGSCDHEFLSPLSCSCLMWLQFCASCRILLANNLIKVSSSFRNVVELIQKTCLGATGVNRIYVLEFLELSFKSMGLCVGSWSPKIFHRLFCSTISIVPFHLWFMFEGSVWIWNEEQPVLVQWGSNSF